MLVPNIPVIVIFVAFSVHKPQGNGRGKNNTK